MNWFSRKKKDPSEKDKVAMLSRIATMTELMKHGFLYLDVQAKKVVIDERLASVFLSKQDKWANFLNNLYTWFVYRASQMAWQKVFLDAEIKAVREAREKFPTLTKLQEKTIRERARTEIDLDKVKLPQIEAYEFIISNDVTTGDEPKIIAVGYYKDGQFDMAPYDKISL